MMDRPASEKPRKDSRFVALMQALTFDRIGGYVLLKDRAISERMKSVMDCAQTVY